MRRSGWLAAALGWISIAIGTAWAQDRQTEPPPPGGRFEKCRYVSSIDGAAIDYALWYPADYAPSKPWPLIVFLHGSAEGADWLAPTQPGAGSPVRTAKPDLPFLVVTPLLRGTWSINGPAELDVLETLADVQTRAHVDPNRIHLTGVSLGAFAGWAIAAHHPDRFASLSLFAGGGSPELAGNLRHVPTWVFHGSADDNVPVKESLRLAQAMEAAGSPVRYTELPGVGHACWLKPYAGDTLYEWMARQTRVHDPRRITYRTSSLRHNRAYWVTVESTVDPARPATIDVFAPESSQIYIHAENVERLILEPPASVVRPGTTPTFFVNDRPVEADSLADGWALKLSEALAGPVRKRHGLSGPIQDVFCDPFVIVTAAHEDPAATELWTQVAQHVFQWTKALTFASFKFISADEVTPEVIRSSNLICIGNHETHNILAQVAYQLPLVFTRTGLQVYGQPASEQVTGMVMIYPNPLNPDGYLVVCSGRPQAVAALAASILRPPYLSPTPLEDLVVITRDGDLPLEGPAPDRASQAGWMAPDVPPRGAVFDNNWQLPPSVVERLIVGPSDKAHGSSGSR